MESRLKRKIFIIVTILMMLCSLPKVVKAAPVVFNVSTGAQFLQAIDDINNGTETDYVISLKADIDVLTTNFIFLTRGNTTILGNGHEITNIYGFMVLPADPNVSIPTLTLGQQDGNNILKINGSYTGNVPPYNMFLVTDESIINMHKGVEIYNRNIPLVNYGGYIFYVGYHATFNMYGGSIKNCFVEKTETSYCAMIRVEYGTLNMLGGQISNNTVQDSPIDDNNRMIYSAVIVSQTGNININGGSITNNKLIFNSTESYGNGVVLHAISSTINISNANISGNEMICNNVNNVQNCSGGAIYAFASTLVIDNSVITNNKVLHNRGYGGGIAVYLTDLTINSSLIAFNTAGGSAADISFDSESGNKLYLPTADSMNAKQTIPYMNLITGWYEDNILGRWSMTNPTPAFTTLQNDALIGFYELVAGYEKAKLITYNSNGGQGADYYQNLGANILALDNAVVGFTRTNYEFTGWNTAADGSGTAYAAGASLPPTDLGFILYAQWKAKPVTPDTGDVFNPNIFMSLMILSGIGLVVLNKKYKRKENN